MENEVVMKVEGLGQGQAKKKILRKIEAMPGVEYAGVDQKSGTVTVIGGDIDRLSLEDEIEAMGYPLVR